MKDVSIIPCASYEETEIEAALDRVLEPLGGLSWVVPGMKIAIKANLVSMMKPEKAATTHPSLLCALVKRLVDRGAQVVLGDSPGGLYTAPVVNRIYAVTGMKAVEPLGAHLNQNFSNSQANFPDAMVTKEFIYTAYLDDVDAIINVCKLKTHGMMGMSASVKNMFGVIPGTFKPEYHFRFPNHKDFAKMLLDLNDYFAEKTKLCIADAVIGMEGNGPTQGSPRRIGALLASADPHSLDLACAALIGLGIHDIPTLEVAAELERIPATAAQLPLHGDLSALAILDFQNIHVHKSLQFEGAGKFASMFVRSALRAAPIPKKKECIGCKKCAQICPAKAIQMKRGIPVIDKKACITCFCCQEFCPTGAMKVHRPLIARILNKRS